MGTISGGIGYFLFLFFCQSSSSVVLDYFSDGRFKSRIGRFFCKDKNNELAFLISNYVIIE